MIRPLDISCAASRSPTRAGPIRWFRSRGPAWLRALSLLASLHGLAHGQALPAQPLPSSAELEAAGATIGEIRFIPQDIFDTRDPKEDKWLFRWANALHIQTRPGVIERALAALPIPWLIYASQDWGWIVLATLLLGVIAGYLLYLPFARALSGATALPGVRRWTSAGWPSGSTSLPATSAWPWPAC